MTIYLLYYDTDYGSNEEWNIFYSNPEAFSTPELREQRIDYLRKAVDEDGEPCEYEFHKVDIEMTDQIDAPHRNQGEDE